MVLGSYLAVKAGGEATKRKGALPRPHFMSFQKEFPAGKGRAGAAERSCGQVAVGQEAPSLQERWGVREGLRLEEGEMVQGRGDAGQGSNSPLTRPQNNAKRDPQGPRCTAQFAATQKLLAAVGLK